MKSDKFLKINKAEKNRKNMAMSRYVYCVKYIKGENVWKVNQRTKVSKSLLTLLD